MWMVWLGRRVGREVEELVTAQEKVETGFQTYQSREKGSVKFLPIVDPVHVITPLVDQVI